MADQPAVRIIPVDIEEIMRGSEMYRVELSGTATAGGVVLAVVRAVNSQGNRVTVAMFPEDVEALLTAVNTELNTHTEGEQDHG